MKKNTTKIISIIAASKLATSTNLVSAGGLGKIQNDSNTPSTSSISLDQVGYPLEILTPPINAENVVINPDNGGKVESSPTGIFFTSDIGKAVNSGLQPRIDFIISGFQNQNTPVVVFLAYSTVIGDPDQWQDLELNGLFLDRDTISIISAFKIDPVSNFGDFNVTSSPLGDINNDNGNSVIVSLNLSDLEDSSFDGDNIYFQAISVPLNNGQFDFSAASISELDHYEISREIVGQEGSGSKVPEASSGSKTEENTSTPAPDSGSKTGENTSTPAPDSGSKTGEEPSEPGVPQVTYKIGDTGPAGGVVIYIGDDRSSGLEAALTDAGTSKWRCRGMSMIDNGTGKSNTDAIIAECGDAYTAAKLARNYIWPNGQRDGFLPNKDELNHLHGQRDVVGNFANALYWSSSQYTPTKAWFQSFGSGRQNGSIMDTPYLVRAVRAF